MTTIALEDSGQNLDRLVELTATGETVVLTRDGRIVAKITKAREGERPKLPDMSEFRASIEIRGEPMSQTVISNRAEERY